MKHTKRRVKHPAPDSILSSFLDSGKRHLILTGCPGSGKSTLLATLFPVDILTRAIPYRHVLMRDPEGREETVARYDEHSDRERQRMRPELSVLADFGVNALRQCEESENDLTVIDEIGYVEWESEEYIKALSRLFSKKRIVAAVRKEVLPQLRAIADNLFVCDLDAPYGNVGCVIMASGDGRRFGGNKLLAPFGDSFLVQCALDVTEGFFAHRTAVTKYSAVAEICERASVCPILHGGGGVDVTVRLGVTLLKDTQSCMFLPADQPLLKRKTVEKLVISAAAMKDRIIRPSFDGCGGSPVIFPATLYDELRSLSKDRGGSFLVSKYPHLVSTVEVSDKSELLDVDTQDALRELLNLKTNAENER